MAGERQRSRAAAATLASDSGVDGSAAAAGIAGRAVADTSGAPGSDAGGGGSSGGRRSADASILSALRAATAAAPAAAPAPVAAADAAAAAAVSALLAPRPALSELELSRLSARLDAAATAQVGSGSGPAGRRMWRRLPARPPPAAASAVEPAPASLLALCCASG